VFHDFLKPLLGKHVGLFDHDKLCPQGQVCGVLWHVCGGDYTIVSESGKETALCEKDILCVTVSWKGLPTISVGKK
jgi:hypothetical protein